MDLGNSADLKDNKQNLGDYSRNRSHMKKQDCSSNAENYGDFSVIKKRGYAQSGAELSSSQNALYSVSQRIPPVSTSYSNLCPGDAGCSSDHASYAGMQTGWDRERSLSNDSKKEDSSDGLSDKQTNDSNTTASVQSSFSSGPLTSNNSESFKGPIIPTCVYLHNNTAILMEIEDTPSASCELLCQAISFCDELGLNKNLACQVFTLWMTSPLLELQLKPSQKPYEIRKCWRSLLEKYSHSMYNRHKTDEPQLGYYRNVFFPLKLEEKIKDPKILELLYEEAKYNINQGRYPCEVSHYIMLGGVQAHIELGPYNPQVHTIHYFREEQSKYLPMHVRKSSTWTWLPISHKNSPEVRLLEHYKRVPSSATNRKLMKKYLEFCWTLPFYGAAFFEGQIEQPVRGLSTLLTYHDVPVLVAINFSGVYVIDDIQCTILLGLRYEELSWEHARPSKENDPNCLPCLFLQFVTVENGARVSKILQVFSKQASLMNNLISQFVNMSKQKSTDEVDNKTMEQQLNPESEITHSSLGIYPNSAPSLPSLANKLNRLTLATFDENGHCIGQMGSWSFSY